MKNYLITALLFLLFTPAKGNCELIAFALTADGTKNLVNYQNPFQAGFSSPDDYFGEFNPIDFDALPSSLIDETLSSPADNLGFKSITTASQFTPLFALSDTVNSQTSGQWVEAQWLFSIAGYNSINLGIDFAAMGDFETSDKLEFDYSIDASEHQALFNIQTENSKEMQYIMASGKSVTFQDPLSIDGQLMTNEFATFNRGIAATGNTLALRLRVKADSGSEIFGLRNINIFGEAAPDVVNVPEPDHRAIFLCAALGLLLRKR
ncbi:hypothetical protein KO525_00075 [Psychrosphaera sp. B3R10]|uniref:hypothetical protein n=1 Tax=unclassified Psychrosphaera TaxID=2641570 RepID=UPI001C081049|nr:MULTISPECIES: hypothetical protein [unclassified Psychrosphaera]MBU2880342.1 hypothetical protein [Psychrosphaera sp. I2R16]MBU2987781.1 hypothetical protein [Psychrosphaera sp. B3R10]MDO6720709.1 hypothetical protein [Psychrosphaera sp. 1_MG-2023]